MLRPGRTLITTTLASLGCAAILVLAVEVATSKDVGSLSTPVALALAWAATVIGYLLLDRAPAARRAVTAERRRLARDLLDGLAQELAYIAAHAPRLAARCGDPAAERIADAAAAALQESRVLLSSLAHEPRAALGASLAQEAERIARREGTAVELDIQDGIEVEPAVHRELLRIVREATTNAVRHGGSSRVSLSLTDIDALVLQIADDGAGFPLDDVPGGPGSGFGLTSMQERAAQVGGDLRVRSDTGHGTVVEVRIV